AGGLAQQGFRAVKFGWGPMGQSETSDIAHVAAARRGLGNGVELMVDAGLAWDTATAIRRAKQFESFNLTWLEEPLHPDNVQGYARLCASNPPMRIAAGEEICDIKEFQTMMDVGGIDVAQVDVTRVGGLMRSKRIGWDSVERHRLCVNHSYKTGVNIAASLHFVAALPNTHYFDYCVEQGAPGQDSMKRLMRRRPTTAPRTSRRRTLLAPLGTSLATWYQRHRAALHGRRGTLIRGGQGQFGHLPAWPPGPSMWPWRLTRRQSH